MLNSEIGAKRILKLADFVAALPKKKFDFGHFVGNDWGGATDLSCGTTACALGWATAMPLFQRAGLYLQRLNSSRWSGAVHYQAADGSVVNSMNGYSGEAVIANEVFGINPATYRRLFIPREDDVDENDDELWNSGKYVSRDATNKQWAKHARGIAREILAAA